MTAASGGGAGSAIGIILLVIFLFAAYITPSIVGYIRHVRDLGSVIIINLLLGWTLIGWAAALAMACRTAKVDRWASGQMTDEPGSDTGRDRGRGQP